MEKTAAAAMSSVASLISELDIAISACVGRVSSSSSDGLVLLRQSLEDRLDEKYFEKLHIRRTRSGLSLPSWVPKAAQSRIGAEDAYVPISTLVREAIQDPNDVENLTGLTNAISKMQITAEP